MRTTRKPSTKAFVLAVENVILGSTQDDAGKLDKELIIYYYLRRVYTKAGLIGLACAWDAISIKAGTSCSEYIVRNVGLPDGGYAIDKPEESVGRIVDRVSGALVANMI